MTDDRGHSDLALGFAFLAGALLGAGIALLLAPRPGAETRAQVADWARRAQERAREAASRLRETASPEAEEA
jgi:gas vesicle protein